MVRALKATGKTNDDIGLALGWRMPWVIQMMPVSWSSVLATSASSEEEQDAGRGRERTLTQNIQKGAALLTLRLLPSGVHPGLVASSNVKQHACVVSSSVSEVL